MKLTDKRVDEIISEAVGDDALKIVKALKGRKDVSEFKIATNMRQDIQIIRNILYRLHSKNLVTYKRRKDNKKGWYISYWTFSRTRVKELIKSINKEKLERFKERLENESTNVNTFCMCSKACIRMDFHNASNYSFRCPECGSLMQQQNNIKTIDFLKAKIKEIEATATV